MKSLFFLNAIMLLFFSCKENNVNEPENGSIMGTVINKVTYEPIPMALISTIPATESIFTNSNGEFRIENIAPGTYFVIAEKNGYYNNQVSVKVIYDKSTNANIFLSDYVSINNPPGPIKIINPQNNSEINNKQVTLRWSSFDEDGDKLNYTVYLDKSNPPISMVANSIQDTSFTINNLADSTDYYWFVICKDIFGATSESEINKFRIDSKSTAHNLTDILHAYYPFDGSTVDQSYNYFDGMENNVSYIIDRKGNQNSAIRFTGNGNISVNSSNFLNFDSNFTCCLWIKPNKSNYIPVDYHVSLVSKGLGQVQYLFFGITTNNEPEFWINNGSGNTFIVANQKITDNVWHHISYVFQAISVTEGICKIYIDGILNCQKIIAKPVQISNYSVKIGGRYNNLDYFSGDMDELYFFNEALTEEDIRIVKEE